MRFTEDQLMIKQLARDFAESELAPIAAKIDAYTPTECILDFSEVSFVDSSGIAVVINSMRRMAQIEGELSLAGLGEQPKRVFRTSGIDRLVRIKEAV